MTGDAGEDVSEPGLGINIVEATALDEREHDGGALASAIGAAE
jgi:hypothetical protein